MFDQVPSISYISSTNCPLDESASRPGWVDQVELSVLHIGWLWYSDIEETDPCE